MFAGIVEETAKVVRFDKNLRRLEIQSSLDQSSTRIGDSIAIDGVCLTVVANKSSLLSFDLAEETLRRTSLGSLAAGAGVHLERSLKIGDRIHGHFVFGHVDGTATLLKREQDGSNDRLTFSFPNDLSGFLTTKGSISVSGVSLTVGEVSKDSFVVYIIPHTADVTRLARLAIGERVNLEVDMLARYTRSILMSAASAPDTISQQFLAQHGYR